MRRQKLVTPELRGDHSFPGGLLTGQPNAHRVSPELLRMTAASHFTVLYDGQCEICQASVAWLQILDTRHLTHSVAVDADSLRLLDPRLDVDACLRELHVLDSNVRLYVGWDAVARLARLFPSTWIIGAVGSLPPLKQLGRLAYRFIARNRHSLSKCRGGACRVAKLDAFANSRARARFGLATPPDFSFVCHWFY